MEHRRDDEEFEQLNRSLNDAEALKAYKKRYDEYRPSALPRVLGQFLVFCGNVVYGEAPSYLKFRAVEVIARVPYHSWESAAYTLLTLFYTHEKKALKLSSTEKFSRLAQDNETMHVIVVSALARQERAGFLRYTLIPMGFAFFYFWASYWLYILNSRYSFELNYMFESHAFEQYSRFIDTNADALKQRAVGSEFLAWYGRAPENQYEFFRSVRNDEIIHRNTSIEEIEKMNTASKPSGFSTHAITEVSH